MRSFVSSGALFALIVSPAALRAQAAERAFVIPGHKITTIKDPVRPLLRIAPAPSYKLSTPPPPKLPPGYAAPTANGRTAKVRAPAGSYTPPTGAKAKAAAGGAKGGGKGGRRAGGSPPQRRAPQAPTLGLGSSKGMGRMGMGGGRRR